MLVAMESRLLTWRMPLIFVRSDGVVSRLYGSVGGCHHPRVRVSVGSLTMSALWTASGSAAAATKIARVLSVERWDRADFPFPITDDLRFGYLEQHPLHCEGSCTNSP
jgi:hypothetical protein